MYGEERIYRKGSFARVAADWRQGCREPHKHEDPTLGIRLTHLFTNTNIIGIHVCAYLRTSVYI